MSNATEYRDFAEQQRQAARNCALPLVRSRHLEAAQRWECLAEETERFEVRSFRQPGMELFY